MTDKRQQELSQTELGNSSMDEEAAGLSITQEQIRDAYFAGTSDGVTFLENGQVRHLDEAPDDDVTK